MWPLGHGQVYVCGQIDVDFEIHRDIRDKLVAIVALGLTQQKGQEANPQNSRIPTGFLHDEGGESIARLRRA